MSWKTDLKLADLDEHTSLECQCVKCGMIHYEDSTRLLAKVEYRQLYLDEVEVFLRCTSPFCRGHVRIALVHDNTEGFVGGMA